MTSDDLAAAGELEVESVQMPVLGAHGAHRRQASTPWTSGPATSVAIIPAARAVREQVDWARVAEDVAGNDFAEVHADPARRLGIVADPS